MASIKQRGDSFQITVSCGYDICGKKITYTKTFKPDANLTPAKREQAVKRFAYEFESKVKNGLVLDGSNTTLKEFSTRWLKEYAILNLQPGTVEKYKRELDDKILPALGHYKLTALKPHMINTFLAGLSKDGARLDGKEGGYSKGTITKAKNILSAILRTAVEWEVIDHNPCSKIHLRIEDTSDKIKYFTPEQVKAFLSFIEQPYKILITGHTRIDDTGKPYTVNDYATEKMIPEQIRVLFTLAIYTGMRKGELLALEWSDIDFEANTIHISKAVTVVNHEQICKAPKTRTSNRDVTIPAFLCQRLKALHKSRDEYKASLKDYWKGENWVFIQDTGKMMNISTPYQALQDAINRYNHDKPKEEQLPLIPFHGLRHTSATLLISTHQDVKTVSRRLGHAQTSTTMNIYAHALESSDRAAANALEEMLTTR